jgi:hypothetical protein
MTQNRCGGCRRSVTVASKRRGIGVWRHFHASRSVSACRKS